MPVVSTVLSILESPILNWTAVGEKRKYEGKQENVFGPVADSASKVD